MRAERVGDAAEIGLDRARAGRPRHYTLCSTASSFGWDRRSPFGRWGIFVESSTRIRARSPASRAGIGTPTTQQKRTLDRGVWLERSQLAGPLVVRVARAGQRLRVVVPSYPTPARCSWGVRSSLRAVGSFSLAVKDDDRRRRRRRSARCARPLTTANTDGIRSGAPLARDPSLRGQGGFLIVACRRYCMYWHW